MNKVSAILYTDCALSRPFAAYFFETLKKALPKEPIDGIVMASNESWKDLAPPGWRYVVENSPQGRSHHDCYWKIIHGLLLAESNVVYLLEHDVLYPQHHFIYFPIDKSAFHYNTNTWCLNREGAWNCPGRTVTSCLCAEKALLLREMQKRIKHMEAGFRIVWDEPGKGWKNHDGTIDFETLGILKKVPWTIAPVIDIRHGANLTGNRSHPVYEKEIPYWGSVKEIWDRIDEK